MPERDSTGLPLTAIRYDVTRWTVAQGLVPFAMLASVAARRVPSTLTIVIAAALLSATLLTFARARCNLGRQILHNEGGKLRLQASGDELSRRTIGQWISQAGMARLHGTRTSYKLRVDEAHRGELEILLSQALGMASSTTPRGSPRARALAAVVLALGIVSLGVALILQSLPFLFVGVPAAVIGGATLGALSQRVIR